MEKLNWIICVLFITLTSGIHYCVTSDSCDIIHGNCNYTVSVSLSNQCDENKAGLLRNKRAEGNTKEDPVMFLASKFKKLSHKLTKEMRHLSKRVLRAVRKMDTLISSLVTKKPRRTLLLGDLCPPGFETLDNWGKCYLFSTFNTTWYEARDFCTALDSEVVGMETIQEHYIVTFLLKNTREYRDMHGWWTSGTFVAKTKQWMWTSNVEMRPFTFIKWAVNEPNSSSLQEPSDTNVQCVMLNTKQNHLWHDTLCTDTFNFICEKSLS